MQKNITIAVFGSSSVLQDSEHALVAYRVGKLLAEAGFVVCNGGYKGTMEACSRGVKEAGGHVVGVTCKSFTNRTPNMYLTEEVCTEDLPERISTLMRIADAYIVLDGNIGTLAELFLAWNVIFMGKPKPLLIVGENMRRGLSALAEHTEIGERHLQLLEFVPTVESAVDYLKSTFQTA
ncbi:MAG: LOG family protein [bacterium]